MSPGVRSLRTFIALTALGLLMQAGSLPASAFKVTPIRVSFNSRSASTLLTLSNESDQALRFQISAFAWTQDASGEMKLTPTEDIVFFPTLVTLQPKEDKKVRVATTAAASDVEKTFRLFFEELPPLEKANSGSGAQVRILTKMGVPIFVTPAKVKEEAKIDGIRVDGGKVCFDIRNTGNVHFAVQKVKVRGLAENGAGIFERDLDGWYVLAGSPRSYEVELPADVCSKVKSIVIDAQTDSTSVTTATVTARADVARQGCKAST